MFLSSFLDLTVVFLQAQQQRDKHEPCSSCCTKNMERRKSTEKAHFKPTRGGALRMVRCWGIQELHRVFSFRFLPRLQSVRAVERPRDSQQNSHVANKHRWTITTDDRICELRREHANPTTWKLSPPVLDEPWQGVAPLARLQGRNGRLTVSPDIFSQFTKKT